MKKENYFRGGIGYKEEILEEFQSYYESKLVKKIKQNGGTHKVGNTIIHLAKEFGFCWGVDKAVSMAFEARKRWKKETIWITNEIIHNPFVNQNLREKGIKFIETLPDGSKNFSVVQKGDVVILPAFGASKSEISLLENKGCPIVDTTCPWVSAVWNRVKFYEKSDFTALIHGKFKHEESIATSSRAKKYLILLNIEEAKWVCDFILNDGKTEDFKQKFAKASSENFAPETDLVKVGIANQTTMLSSESLEIAKMFERAMMKKYGAENLNEHFLSFDTICNATQERQDAVTKLVKEKLDLIIVIGGFNSSNTSHLLEIGELKNIKSFHIDSKERIFGLEQIEHKTLDGKIVQTKNWLPEKEILNIGITSGASTPDILVEEVIKKIVTLRNEKIAGV
ncbi:4-hydroxy-3-methylbut-2-enyl diphosphate reductase [bacterium]|nr:4-hydroxy-3-methylbut-2-enyl diphosphate reductase [bacterium]